MNIEYGNLNLEYMIYENNCFITVKIEDQDAYAYT